MAKAYFARGDYNKAEQYVRMAGAGPKMSPALRSELQQMDQQLQAIRMKQQETGIQPWRNMNRLPAQDFQRQMSNYRQQELLRRKQVLQQILDNPLRLGSGKTVGANRWNRPSGKWTIRLVEFPNVGSLVTIGTAVWLGHASSQRTRGTLP